MNVRVTAKVEATDFNHFFFFVNKRR